MIFGADQEDRSLGTREDVLTIQLHFVSYQKSLACDSIIMTSDKVYLWCTFAFRLVENYFLKIYSEKWQAFVAIDLLLNVHKLIVLCSALIKTC